MALVQTEVSSDLLVSGCDTTFNVALVNLYDPTATIPPHRDDEACIVDGTVIASVSFGQSRTMRLGAVIPGSLSIKTPDGCTDILLGDNSLALLTPEVNAVYQHAISKQSSKDAKLEIAGRTYRINMTFREQTQPDPIRKPQ